MTRGNFRASSLDTVFCRLGLDVFGGMGRAMSFSGCDIWSLGLNCIQRIRHFPLIETYALVKHVLLKIAQRFRVTRGRLSPECCRKRQEFLRHRPLQG